MRRIECREYPECLKRAALLNDRNFSCDGCGEYRWSDPTEEEETLRTGEEKTMEEKKTCRKCGKEKVLDDFNKGPGHKDKRKNICRECEADYLKEYRVRKAAGQVKSRKGALRKRVIRNAKAAVKAQHGQEELVRGTRAESPQTPAAEAHAMGYGRMDRARELAEEHWEYVRGLLMAHGDDGEPDVLNQIEFHYKSAMIHGYKHGLQDAAAK